MQFLKIKSENYERLIISFGIWGIIIFILILCSFLNEKYLVFAQTTEKGNYYVDSFNGSDSINRTNQAQVTTKIYLPILMVPCFGNCYYVDSVNGSDTNSGTSIDKPWRTLTPVNTYKFLPGDIIYFRRNSTWNDGLFIKDSGLPGKPIIFTSYGAGNLPVFRNPGDSSHYTQALSINADWVIVNGLMLQDASVAGVYIHNGADHNIIQDTEVTNVGIGIYIDGQYNLVTRNYIHDLHMVVNTPGGNDDYGAVGIQILNSNNEISYNKMVKCKAPSSDYGTDGGALEFYSNADNNYVHHNWSESSNGFLEVGGHSGNHALNNIVAYNVSLNNGYFSVIHTIGTYYGTDYNFRIENNTIIETQPYNSLNWSLFIFDGPTTDPNDYILQNNIIYAGDGVEYISQADNRGWLFVHKNNLYYILTPSITQMGFNIDPSEKIADPLFVNLSNRDFHLQSNSPAIDAGAYLGFKSDFDNRPVPIDKPPDIGAFECKGSL